MSLDGKIELMNLVIQQTIVVWNNFVILMNVLYYLFCCARLLELSLTIISIGVKDVPIVATIFICLVHCVLSTTDNPLSFK